MMGVPQRLPQMVRPVLVLTTAVSLAFTVVVRAADDKWVLDRFASYLDSLRAQAAIPGLAASIIGSGSVIWERPFGRRNLDRSMDVQADTPFHLDGVTQIVTASLVLRCVEERRLSLNDRIDQYTSDTSEPGATLGQILSHTSMQAGALVFAYRLERFDLLAAPLAACMDEPFRQSVAGLLRRLGMLTDSVPGPDATAPPASDGVDQSMIDYYESALGRLATGYTVNGSSAAVASYSARTLKPSSGLITSVRDFAHFDLALKKPPLLLRSDSISTAWQAPLGANGRRLPHGLGWFVQTYNGETIVWQFGEGTASSSMVITVPGRGLTLILLANSNGLTRGFNLKAGDVSVSPFAKAFLGTFLR